MVSLNDYRSEDPIAWCPGCGNFPLLNALKKALVEVGKEPHEIVIVSGIGQAAKTPHYLRCNAFNGLHGRALPVAIGIKLGTIDGAIVWDAVASKYTNEAQVVSIDRDKNVCPAVGAAVLTLAKNAAGGEAFLAYMTSDEGKTVLQEAGYTVDEP